MDIKEFDAFMMSITGKSISGKNGSKDLGHGRVLQNCVALCNAWAILNTGKDLCVGNPCIFPVNTQKASVGDIAIWDDHVAIVYDAKNYICISSAYNSYFYRHMTYKNWQRAGHKFRGFYHFPNMKTTHDLDNIAKEVVVGTYGNGATRTKRLKALGLSTEELNEVQNKVYALLK